MTIQQHTISKLLFDDAIQFLGTGVRYPWEIIGKRKAKSFFKSDHFNHSLVLSIMSNKKTRLIAMTPLFYLLIIFFIINVGNCQICDNSYSCQLQTVSNISNCRGYFACYESPSITYTSHFYCLGSYSCYKVNTIRASTNIYCNGLYSCAFVQKMDGWTQGNGAYSAYAVTIGSGGNFYGYASCYNCTTIMQSGKNFLYNSGALAFVNSHISSATTTSTSRGYSYLTFYNSEYHCLNGHQCVMQCYGGNSCENAIFTCDAGATCTVDCQYRYLCKFIKNNHFNSYKTATKAVKSLLNCLA